MCILTSGNEPENAKISRAVSLSSGHVNTGGGLLLAAGSELSAAARTTKRVLLLLLLLHDRNGRHTLRLLLLLHAAACCKRCGGHGESTQSLSEGGKCGDHTVQATTTERLQN